MKLIDNSSVSALIVTYNPDVDVLKKSIEQILIQVNFVIVVDNNSHNCDDVYHICSQNEKIHVIKNAKNMGLARAQNQAIKYVIKNTPSKYFIIFDQDSVIKSDFVINLKNCYESLILNHIKVAAVGPIFFDSISMEQYPVTRYVGPFIKRLSNKDKSIPIDATFIIASGCMISCEVISIIGMMKEEFFIDYIDVEWCLRAKSLGFSVFVEPKAEMVHSIGDKRLSIFGRSVSVHSPIRRYYLIRNSIFMLKLPYIPLGYKLREVAFNILRIGISIFLANDKANTIKFIYKGIFDGMFGRFETFK